MRIVNLVENTEGAPGCVAAHGLSFYVETEHHRLLMDTGPSGLLIQNALALGVDLERVDSVFISHGHYDHSDGLPALAALNPDAAIYIRRGAEREYCSDDGNPGNMHYIGMDRRVPGLGQICWVDGDARIDEELTLFTHIAGRRHWPQGNRHLMVRIDDRCIQDDFAHEQCLLVAEDGMRVLFSGCAHSGILNIMERCIDVAGGPPDVVFSGFHMMKRGDYTPEERETILATARELLRWPSIYYTCHCTGLPAYEMMRDIMGDRLRYIHCGEAIELNRSRQTHEAQ